LFGGARRLRLECLQEQELENLTQAVDECRPISIAALELFKSFTAFFRDRVSSHCDIESSTGWQSERPPAWGEKRRGLFRNLRTTVVPRMMIISVIAKEVASKTHLLYSERSPHERLTLHSRQNVTDLSFDTNRFQTFLARAIQLESQVKNRRRLLYFSLTVEPPGGCVIIMLLCGVFILLSSFLGVYFTIHKEYGYIMGHSFTLAGYVMAFVACVSTTLITYHYPKCTCWGNSENRIQDENEQTPMVPRNVQHSSGEWRVMAVESCAVKWNKQGRNLLRTICEFRIKT
jgi:hypothetical protein